jgi:hypothetical protein
VQKCQNRGLITKKVNFTQTFISILSKASELFVFDDILLQFIDDNLEDQSDRFEDEEINNERSKCKTIVLLHISH